MPSAGGRVSERASEAVALLAAVQGRVAKKMDAGLGAHGLSLTDFMVLRRLERAAGGAMRRIDLARALGLSASGVTRLLGPMERMGLVEKEASERDARVSLVRLSRAGARVYAEAAVSFAHGAGEALKPLGEKRIEALCGLLEMVG